jgi:predicted nucleic acid-binding protein
MKLAYVDSSVWITYVEGFTSYQQQIDEKLEQLAAEGWLFCTSDVVKLEILPKLYAMQNHQLFELYERLFSQLNFLESPADVFREALTYAKIEGLKAIDAIHLTIAIKQGCHCFISTDAHFKNLKSLLPVWIDLQNQR